MLIYINHDDMRSLELMEEMIRRGYYVSDQLKDMKYADVIYMGVKGMDCKNRLLTNQETIFIDEKIFDDLKNNCLLVTLIHNAYLKRISDSRSFRYMALLDNEEFVKENSVLTAEGLLSYIIAHRRYPLYQSRICVLGFGNCAKPIIEYMIALKSDVSVAVRNPQYQQEIETMGAHYLCLNEIDLSEKDILINTIPCMIIDNKQLDKANRKIMIIDIASYPYGVDHHYALSKGLNCQILPSIPCKYAYGYAGKMVADEIEREYENA